VRAMACGARSSPSCSDSHAYHGDSLHVYAATLKRVRLVC
jgi:hypothetical protein